MDRYTFRPLLGRILTGAPFLMSGRGKLAAYRATVGYITAVGLPIAGRSDQLLRIGSSKESV
jgi:putative oxidoreductase